MKAPERSRNFARVRSRVDDSLVGRLLPMDVACLLDNIWGICVHAEHGDSLVPWKVL